ncbi:hypothetical protein GT347_16975 [Xylophilus rhododendri]|uniref:Uncharacterized protein n=1 Tax=Xylophilus rhododendri TaxID=2697032 RepID=A0A857J9U0_9BURK|nr:hypothetical protein [Xylophilus rhododendri]QHI99515.1 hypothetical protein GT347_16975 [Xylophilus rhododendri]
MHCKGRFISEAYKDGRRYVFEASFDDLRWHATIWDEEGQLHGDIECAPCGQGRCGEELEDAVSDWVHNAIAFEVGFSPSDHCVHPSPAEQLATVMRGPMV